MPQVARIQGEYGSCNPTLFHQNSTSHQTTRRIELGMEPAMNTLSHKLALTVGLTLALCCPLFGRAAQPTAAAGTPIGLNVTVSSATLLSLYLAAHSELRANPAFARDWTAVTKCAAWTPIARDEFRAALFLKAGAAELAAARDPAPQAFDLRFDRNLDRYDAAKQEFGLRTLGPNDALPVRIPGFYGERGQSAFKFGCDPTGGSYPVEFTVTFDNPEVANGLPMAPDAAATFAQARTSPNGNRDARVGVDLTLQLTLGTPHPVDPPYVAKGVVVPVSAHIVDVAVDDGTPQHRVIYRLTDGKRKEGEAAAAASREQARVEALAKPLDAAALQAQFDMERAAAKVGLQPFRIGVNASWSKVDGVTYSFPLKPSDMFSMGGGVSLRFDNAAEAAALAPTPELAALLSKTTPSGISLTYVPVGASDDPLKGGPIVVGHVSSVETEDRSTGARRILAVRTASAPAPWKADSDDRGAAAFDVLGIKVGMAPDDVAAIASSQLGQKLALDESKGEVRSPGSECEFDYVRRQPPPLGRRCLVAAFAKSGAGGAWALVRLRLTQSLATAQEDKFGPALMAKYGKPDLARRYDPPATLADSEGDDPPQAAAIGWGSRVSDRRPEPDGVPFPLHAMEMTSKSAAGVTVLTLTLTDWASITAAADVAAAAKKRAGEAVVPKF